LLSQDYEEHKSSVVDPDQVGSETFSMIRIQKILSCNLTHLQDGNTKVKFS